MAASTASMDTLCTSLGSSPLRDSSYLARSFSTQSGLHGASLSRRVMTLKVVEADSRQTLNPATPNPAEWNPVNDRLSCAPGGIFGTH